MTFVTNILRLFGETVAKLMVFKMSLWLFFHVKVHHMQNTPFNNKERFYFMHEKSGREACDEIEMFQKFVFFTAQVKYLF